MKVKIYTGLSATARDVQRVLPSAIVAGPIARGDVLNDIASGVNVVGIIDGNFYQKLAVSPSEIMDALRCGVRVYGASSLGALRAVELERFGMIGCGAIVDHIRNQACFRDDQLGQLVFSDQRAVTLPYVDLYFAMQQSIATATVTALQAERILQVYHALFFEDRTIAVLERQLSEAYPRTDWRALIGAALKASKTQKHRDAMTLLQRIRADLGHVQRVNRALGSL